MQDYKCVMVWILTLHYKIPRKATDVAKRIMQKLSYAYTKVKTYSIKAYFAA
jgi:hypothetical protein